MPSVSEMKGIVPVVDDWHPLRHGGLFECCRKIGRQFPVDPQETGLARSGERREAASVGCGDPAPGPAAPIDQPLHVAVPKQRVPFDFNPRLFECGKKLKQSVACAGGVAIVSGKRQNPHQPSSSSLFTTGARLVFHSGRASPKVSFSLAPSSTDHAGRFAGVGKSLVGIGRI